MFFLCVVVYCVVAALAAELQDITTIARTDGAGITNIDTTLTLDQVTLGSLKTRLYNGGLPGPTFRLRRGDIVKVKVKNNLDQTACGFAAGEEVTNGVLNTIRDLCITNLHTHGLHVSSVEPQDNVLVEIRPGETYQYIYQIPADHQGGTHWYHPHHHGSTGSQVDGGASGLIIVEDEDEDELPSVIKNMPEKAILLTAISDDLAAIEEAGGGTWATYSPPAPMLLANGDVSPTVTIASGSNPNIMWMRFRFAFSAAAHSLAITVPSSCKAKLLAKDGVYLPRGSRDVTILRFAPGNRADIALSCSVGVHTFSSSPNDAAGNPFPATDVFMVDWKQSGGGTEAVLAALPALTFKAPDYLRDLTTTEPDEIFANGIDIGGGGGGGGFGGCEFPCGPFEHETVLQYMSVNKVQQMDVNAGAHPYHMHINHMQLSTVGGGGWDGWHQEGDFMDTYLGTGTVRFVTADFTGDVMMHCHLLLHEDMGCMTHMHIVEDKNTEPWGYCINGTAIPNVAAILMSCLSPLFACLLLIFYTGQIQTLKQKLMPGDWCRPVSEGTVLGLDRAHFGLIATVLVVLLFVLSVLPLVDDNGYNTSSLMALLHANQNSYNTFLPLYIVMMLLTLTAATWLVYLRWFQVNNDNSGDKTVVPEDGDIALVAITTAAGIDADEAEAAELGTDKSAVPDEENSLVPKDADADVGTDN